VFVPDNDFSSFLIFATVNIKCLAVLDVDEVFSIILEYLVPFAAGVPDLHVIGSSGALDVP
jgi:hypothetical protein